MCVSSVEYSVLMNNEEVGPIKPGRGLRQRDPLSPYLYILCADGLSSLIKGAERRGILHGIKICRGAPLDSHLLFAYDSFLFFQATGQEVNTVKGLLTLYENASGQAINYQKSEVCFRSNVSHENRISLSAILGVREALGSGLYLGWWEEIKGYFQLHKGQNLDKSQFMAL